ncbi:hypothetical protein BEWA_043850 [Theileria equi strain WA]|uniref:Uncharacterized protein n=1 Tax=Theileria equi strain WA TaxID=1537102 RepID=L1LGE8_THEEQ|nr:hypothetical protein BEWA_043850 [Theileria equi strain WA]EKX74344.1 hypothetical protein BEWA_043850 [Theileria equi strain WA]|eukprot:XP_004833796.1 hypothetical protein BEWA_043850 [Theileria equi strain WA]
MTAPSCSAHHSSTPEGGVIYLGGHKDGLTSDPHTLMVSKSAMVNDEVFTIHLDSQITTGFEWMCLDVYPKGSYPIKSGNYHDALRDVLTKEHKENRSENGCKNHHISVSKFHTLKGSASSGILVSGAPERSAATLVIEKDVPLGSYVILLGYGSTFRNTDFPSFKEIHITVVE